MRALYLGLGVGLLPVLAQAGEPSEPDDSFIYMGIPAGQCAWPTTVGVQSGGGICSGTLVHPQVIVYAAHCGAGTKTMHFGENLGFGGEDLVTSQCQTNPAYAGAGDQAHDWAYCVLPGPVGLPVTPVLFGCEVDVLEPGGQVAIVGFGQTENQGAGTKHWNMTTLSSVNILQNTITVGGGGLPSVCPGDSGGPAFVELADGGWRAFGIASTVNGGCGGLGTHSLIPGAVEWIETESGVDITPCHDQDGTWNPTADCGDFFAGGSQGVGSWADGCAGTPTTDLSATCGPVYGTEEESIPPDVTIVDPPDDVVIPDAPAPVDFLVEATDDSGYIAGVSLRINGDLQDDTDTEAPYEFAGAIFPMGEFEVVAVAQDFFGNVGESAPVTIYVGVEPPADSGDDSGDGSGVTEGDGSETAAGSDDGTGGGGAGEDGGGGCGCVAGGDPRSPTAALAALAFGVAFIRRRRVRGFQAAP